MSLKQLGAAFLCGILFISGCHSSNPASNPTVRNVKIAQWGQALYLIVNISIWETSVPGKVATQVLMSIPDQAVVLVSRSPNLNGMLAYR
jgi:hypothetical protein